MTRRRLRREVFERDRGVCAECGRDCLRLQCEAWDHLPGDGGGIERWAADLLAAGFDPAGPFWEADHVEPLWAGGIDSLENVQTLCQPCHAEKTAREARVREARPCRA